MPAHPKPTAKAKSPRAMSSKPAAPKTMKERGPIPAKKPSKAVAALKDAATNGPAKVTAIKVQNDSSQSKTDLILSMLRQPSGATSAEMEEATGWKPHSVRGMLGTLRKRGINVVSTKNPKEPTVYRIMAPKAEPVGDVV